MHQQKCQGGGKSFSRYKFATRLKSQGIKYVIWTMFRQCKSIAEWELKGKQCHDIWHVACRAGPGVQFFILIGVQGCLNIDGLLHNGNCSPWVLWLRIKDQCSTVVTCSCFWHEPPELSRLNFWFSVLAYFKVCLYAYLLQFYLLKHLFKNETGLGKDCSRNPTY